VAAGIPACQRGNVAQASACVVLIWALRKLKLHMFLCVGFLNKTQVKTTQAEACATKCGLHFAPEKI
jgi:hypothetical protein